MRKLKTGERRLASGAGFNPFSVFSLCRRWDSNSSVVLPEADASPATDNVLYIVGILRSANPATCPAECLREILHQNRHIVRTATAEAGDGSPSIGAKQYLPFYSAQDRWQEHFGRKWQRFSARKSQFDPYSILAPGLGIFPRKLSSQPAASFLS